MNERWNQLIRSVFIKRGESTNSNHYSKSAEKRSWNRASHLSVTFLSLLLSHPSSGFIYRNTAAADIKRYPTRLAGIPHASCFRREWRKRESEGSLSLWWDGLGCFLRCKSEFLTPHTNVSPACNGKTAHQPALISVIYTLLFSFPLNSLARGSCALPPNPSCKKIETLDAKLSSLFVFLSGLFLISIGSLTYFYELVLLTALIQKLHQQFSGSFTSSHNFVLLVIATWHITCSDKAIYRHKLLFLPIIAH